MQPPVWISILFTFIGTLVYIQIFEAHAFQVSSCYGSEFCNHFSLNCSAGEIIQVNSLHYGLYGERQSKCNNATCKSEPSCCSYVLGDCLVEIPKEHKNSILDKCSGRSSCGSIKFDWIALSTPSCSGPTTKYGVIDYTCVYGGNADSNSLPTIIGVVIAATSVIVVVTVALIILKRRQTKRRKDDTHISDVPKGLKNHTYERSLETGESKATVEASNYDIINDESVPTLSLPNKYKNDTTSIRESAKKYGNVSSEEYDRIELERKVAKKASNYDRLQSLKGKIGDDPYSHVSNGSKSVSAATDIANDYSHCKLNSNDTLRNGNDYSNVDVIGDCRKNPEPDINEEDPYNHIDFDDPKHPMQNGTAVNGDNESDSENNSPTCIDDKSPDVEGENCLLNNKDTEVSLINAQHQRIKSVSLVDNNTEMSPRSKDQHYTAVVKVKNAKWSNGIYSVAEENVDSKIPNELFNTPINPDYELVKTTNL